MKQTYNNDLTHKNILIICTGNSCRSQIAEGFLKKLMPFTHVFSAGIETHGVNDRAIKTMSEVDIDISLQTSNHIDEYKDIENGKIDPENNPLKNAPHTVEDLIGDWDRPYTRERACYPPGAFRVDKYWSPVNRVDNAYGDRNLMCSCPTMESYK